MPTFRTFRYYWFYFYVYVSVFYLRIIMTDYARGFELTVSKSSPKNEQTLSGKIEELDRHIQELGANIVYLSEVIKVADRECLF